MKRTLALLGLLLVPVSASAAFPDVPAGYEHRRAVEYLQSVDILRGYPDGTFRPTGTINRAELLKILVAGTGVQPPPDLFMACFPDVLDQWFAPYVCYAQQAGWVQGYPDGTFGPERPVTFAEAVKMLTNIRGYPMAPPEESAKRGIDPTVWFAPHLTTALLIDVVSYDQVWGERAIPLQQSLRRGFVAQLLYRAMLAEGLLRMPLSQLCVTSPSEIEIRTYVDVLIPSRTNIFRQDILGVDSAGTTCALATDANPFGRVASAFDPYFLQPYPAGQPTDSWTVRVPLSFGRAILRGGKLGTGGFRPEVFVVDVSEGVLRQLPSIFAGAGGSLQTKDGRYIVFVGSAGSTLEAVDLQAGNHVVLDAVQAPLSFLSAPEGGPSVTLSSAGTNVVTYSLYDASTPSGDGYMLLETRTADIDAAFSPSSVPMPPMDASGSTVIDPLAPESQPSSSDDPFSQS